MMENCYYIWEVVGAEGDSTQSNKTRKPFKNMDAEESRGQVKLIMKLSGGCSRCTGMRRCLGSERCQKWFFWKTFSA